MSLQKRYNQIAQDFIERIMQEEDGSYSYLGTSYSADELEQLTHDVRVDIEHEAGAYMSQESVRACGEQYWSGRQTIFD